MPRVSGVLEELAALSRGGSGLEWCEGLWGPSGHLRVTGLGVADQRAGDPEAALGWVPQGAVDDWPCPGALAGPEQSACPSPAVSERRCQGRAGTLDRRRRGAVEPAGAEDRKGSAGLSGQTVPPGAGLAGHIQRAWTPSSAVANIHPGLECTVRAPLSLRCVSCIICEMGWSREE